MPGLGKQRGPMPRKCGTLGGMLKLYFPPFLHVFLLTLPRSPSCCAHHTHTQIPSRLPSTSLTQVLQRAANAHKGLFITRLHTRCHIRGSGSCAALAEGAKRGGVYATLEVTFSACKPTVWKLAGVMRFSCISRGIFCCRGAWSEEEYWQLTPLAFKKSQLRAQVTLNKSREYIVQSKWVPQNKISNKWATLILFHAAEVVAHICRNSTGNHSHLRGAWLFSHPTHSHLLVPHTCSARPWCFNWCIVFGIV